MISTRTKSQLQSALREDIGKGDLTSEIFIPRRARARAFMVTRESGVFFGEAVARELAKSLDPNLRLKFLIRDGRRFRKNQKLLEIRGSARSILKLERTLLNFLARLSGVATLTRHFVDNVKPYRVSVLDTRKTTPLWRELEKNAVRAGGGRNHRLGLFDEVLVKDNHWAAMWDLLDQTKCRYFMDRLVGAGLVPALRLRQGRPQGAPLRKGLRVPVEIEVKNLRELAHLLSHVGARRCLAPTFIPDRILLDNFSIPNLKRAVRLVRDKCHSKVGAGFLRLLKWQGAETVPLLEASGGITLQNVRAVAATGVDRISIGRLTHSAPALDFSLSLE